MAKVFVIVLTYNSQEVISDCLNSILHSDTSAYQSVIVVDNNSTDRTVEIVKEFIAKLHLKRSDLQREADPDVTSAKEGRTSFKMIENKGNLGFSAGNNVGIKYAMEDELDYIFLLNPDTTIESNTLRILLETAQSDPEVGIVGSKIYYSGTERSDFQRETEPRLEASAKEGRTSQESEGQTFLYAGGVLDWQNAKNFHRGIGEIDQGQYDRLEETGFVSGAALFISRKVIEKIGLLDEKYFLYYEDADWCVRAKKAGFKIMYQPKAVVLHQESTVTKKGSPNYYYYFTRNRLYFIAKFFNPNNKAIWLYFLETLRAIKNIVKLFNKDEREQSRAILQGMGDFVRGRFGKR